MNTVLFQQKISSLIRTYDKMFYKSIKNVNGINFWDKISRLVKMMNLERWLEETESIRRQIGLKDNFSLIILYKEIKEKAGGLFALKFSRLANLLGIPNPVKPSVEKQNEVEIVHKEVIAQAEATTIYETLPANFRNIHEPEMSENDYAQFAEAYFVKKYYEVQKEKVPVIEAKIKTYQQNIEDIKGERGDQFKNIREHNEEKIKQAKNEISEIRRISGKPLTEQHEQQRQSILSMINSQYQTDNKKFASDVKEFVLKSLANKAMFQEKVWEFYPTPYEVVDTMIEQADIQPGMSILEPNGGKGNILDKLYEKYSDSIRLETIELDNTNRMILKIKGYKLVGTNFLEQVPEARYDRILMNPPFNNMEDIDHVLHALKFLKPNGKLVCISSMKSVGSKKYPKTIAFRELVETCGKFVVLPADVMEKAERSATVKIIMSVIDNSKVINKQKALISQDIEIKDLEKGGKVVNITNDRLYIIKSINPFVLLEEGTTKERNFGVIDSLIGIFRKFDEEKDGELYSRNRNRRNSGYRPIIRGSGIDNKWRKSGLVDARPTFSQKPKGKRLDETFAKALMPHQVDGVNLALESLRSTGAFILADGTGAGKTFQQLGVAYQQLKENPDKAVMIISQADDILNQAFKGDAEKLLSKTGINMSKIMVLDKYILKNPVQAKTQIKPGHIYLLKYKDFSLFDMKGDPTYVAYLELVEEKKKKMEVYEKKLLQLSLDGDKYTKKEYKDLEQGIKTAKKNDPINGELIQAEALWIDTEKGYFADLGRNFSCVIFDECHNLKNYLYYSSSKNEQARRGIAVCENIPARLFCSATPADRADAIFYLKYAGLFINNEQMHSLLMRVGFKFKEPVVTPQGVLIERAKYFLPAQYDKSIASKAIEVMFEDLTEESRMLKREIEMNNIELEVVEIDSGNMAKIVNAKIADAAKDNDKEKKTNVYMEQMRALEPFKIKPAIEIIDKELDKGRSVVVFTGLVAEDDKMKDFGGFKAGTTQDLYDALCDKYGDDEVGLIIGTNKNFIYRGKRKNDRQQDIKDFQLNKKRIIIATAQSGGTGISLDDTDQYNERGEMISKGGNNPRSMLVMTAPMNAEGNVQMIGRINRANTMSRCNVFYLFDMSVVIEKWIASIVEQKMMFLNAVVAGQTAKMNIKSMDTTNKVYDSEDELDLIIDINNYRDDDDKEDKKITRKHKFFDMERLDKDTTGINTNIIAWKQVGNEWYDRGKIIVNVKTASRASTLELFANNDFFAKYGFKIETERYEGSVIRRTINKSDSDLIQIWNYICNLFLPESSDYLQSEKQLFNVGDKVKTIEIVQDLISNRQAEKGQVGIIKNIRKINISSATSKYQYDVDFDGNLIKRIEQISLKNPDSISLLTYAEIVKRDDFTVSKYIGSINVSNGKYELTATKYRHNTITWHFQVSENLNLDIFDVSADPNSDLGFSIKPAYEFEHDTKEFIKRNSYHDENLQTYLDDEHIEQYKELVSDELESAITMYNKDMQGYGILNDNLSDFSIISKFHSLKNKAGDFFREKFERISQILNIKNNNESSIVYGKACKIATPSEVLQAKYAVVELEYLIPSNDPFTFSPNPNYPAECQTRSYNEDKAEQEKVVKYASDFNYSHLLNNSPDATTGSPIVTPQGAVLGGNGRTMVLYRVAENHKKSYSEYVNELKDLSGYFGFPEAVIDSFEKPVLVRVVNISLNKCSMYSNILNKSNSNEYDSVREGIAFAKQLEENPKALEMITSILDNSTAETFKQVINDRSTAKHLITLLRNLKIINNTNQGSLTESDSEFTDKGTDFLEAILLAMVLPDKKLISGAKVYTLKILKALPSLIRMKNMPSEWNLIPVLQDIIRNEIIRRSKNLKFGDYINQEWMFETTPSPIVIETWKLLEGLGANQFADFVHYYSDKYSEQGADMFGTTTSPIEIITKFTKKAGLSDLASFPLIPLLTNLVTSAIPALMADDITSNDSTSVPQVADDIGKLQDYAELPDYEDATPKTYTLNQVKSVKTEYINFIHPKNRRLLGKIACPFMILIWGPRGQGKSTYSLILADELSRHDKTLYFTSEEKIVDGRIKERCFRMGIFNSRLEFKDGLFPDLQELVGTGEFKYIVIDSINMVGAKEDEVVKLIQANPKISFIVIAHASKDGKMYKGNSLLGHMCDTEIKVANAVASLIKHRDGSIDNSETRIFDMRRQR